MRILIEVNIVIQFQDCNIVVERSSVEFGMDEDANDVTFDIREKLDVVVNVPFSESSTKITTCMGLDTVSSGNDVPGRDEGATADVNAFLVLRILLENGDLPGILT